MSKTIALIAHDGRKAEMVALKKTQKTPKTEIEKAFKIMEEYQNENKK